MIGSVVVAGEIFRGAALVTECPSISSENIDGSLVVWSGATVVVGLLLGTVVTSGAAILTMETGGLSLDVVVVYGTTVAAIGCSLLCVMVTDVVVFARTIGVLSSTRTGVLGRWTWDVAAVSVGFSLGVVVGVVDGYVGVVVSTIVGSGCSSSSFAWRMEERWRVDARRGL